MPASLRRPALMSAAVLVALLAVPVAASAATVSASGTVVTYTGDADVDALNVGQIPPNLLEFDAGAKDLVAGAGCAVIGGGGDGGDDVECPGAWTSVVVSLGDGADTLDMERALGGDEVTIPATIDAGAGLDVVQGGAGNDHIDLGANGGLGYGAAGDDTLTGTTAAVGERLELTGNGGNDSISVAGAFAATTPWAYGDLGNDTITGGPGNGYLNGDDGIDTITGGVGSEVLAGGPGTDTLRGGDGDDNLRSGDIVTLVGPGVGTATSDGADSMSGGPGSDTVSYSGRTTAVTIDLAVAAGHGQAGENDTITEVEHATGGDAGDVLLGTDAPNVLLGTGGADQIDGRGAFDQLRGGDDADTITAGSDATADLVDCGAGFRATANAALPAGSDVDATTLDHLDVLDPIADCEGVTRAAAPVPVPPFQQATDGADSIVGTSLADTIFGLAGNDTIRGGEGDDELHGNAGADTLLGQGGSDELVGNADNDVLRGGPGTDLAAGRGGNDRLFGDQGNDELDGGRDNDAIAGGTGNDDLDGRDGIDSLLGQAGADDLRGGRGRDVLSGGAGNDLLVGGANPDRIDGGPGRDWIFARDGARDQVTCTKVNLRIASQRSQRDYLVADRLDRITNRAWCARVVLL